MAIYSYNDFKTAAERAGLLEEFSSADLKLAEKNPDAGMSLLKCKSDYKNASTDEEKALINAKANNVRSSFGGYTGGGDGGSFSLTQLSPQNFEYTSAPTYSREYKKKADDLLSALTNYKDFTYDASKDPLYSQYKKAYTREGKRATEDTVASASAATGGRPSSYAVTAAAQQGNYYASQLSDKIPELYEVAYNKYLNDFSLKQSQLAAVQDADQAAYQKYLNQLSQYNTDRSFAYNKHLNEIDSQRQEASDALEKAQIAANYGDYSGLKDLGITPDTESAAEQAQYEQFLELAKIAADAGDYSYVEQLLGGKITPSDDNNKRTVSLFDTDEYKTAQLLDKINGNNDATTAFLQKYGLLSVQEPGPKSVSEAGGREKAYTYLTDQGYDVLTLREFGALKRDVDNGVIKPNQKESAIIQCSTYEEYLNMLFSWAG